MDYTTLGRTGLRVSVAGLGCGGFSRLGLGTGKSEDHAEGIVRRALGLGINLFDTAAGYGTETVVGRALKDTPRDQVVICTKALVPAVDDAPARVVASLEASLKALGTDHIDVFQLHGVPPAEYGRARDQIAPALLRERDKGKLRFLGITETAPGDVEHEMLGQAASDGVWDVVMVAFHMLHQNARKSVFPLTQRNKIGTLLMFAVRRIFSEPELLSQWMRTLADAKQVPAWLAERAEPLDFLVHEGGADSLQDAAYRTARHEPGVDVVLFGTGDPAHVDINVHSLLKPPLPDADRAKLAELFQHLVGVGLDRPDRASAIRAQAGAKS